MEDQSRNCGGPASADRLNQSCYCLTLDRKALCAALEQQSGDPSFCRSYVIPRSHLFSNVPVFLPASSLATMQEVVTAIHTVGGLRAYRERVLSWAPAIARTDPGPAGVFMGFDFHLTEAGPKLIEINTNAGGAFLNDLLARAQLACCAPMAPEARAASPGEFPDEVVKMFEAEWQLHRSGRPLRRIAIVDDAPETQYLYPELILARQMLTRAGYETVIASPEALEFVDRKLLHERKSIDLVYNRLVDFALEFPEHEVLRRAYESCAVALTPNPYNHALFANKQNLVLLSNRQTLSEMGASLELQDVLKAVPHTVILTPDNAADLWSRRKSLFFKPTRGYGSKAVYRGDKITRGVFEQIAVGGYVAQTLERASERMIQIKDVTAPQKVDVRLYAYAGKTLFAAARIYQGQTTNFRTPGGGFAPVFIV